MKFSTLTSLMLALVMGINSIPAIATVNLNEVEPNSISPEQIVLLKKHLAEARNAEASDMDMETFEKKLDENLEQMDKESRAKLEKISEVKALAHYQVTKKIINKGKNETLKQLVEELDQSELTAKEKLQALNARSENKHIMKSLIVEMVSREGGVKNFLKKAQEKLEKKEKKKEKKQKNKPSNNDDSVDWEVFSQVLGIVALIVIGVVFGPEVLLAYLAWEAIAALIVVGLVILVTIIIVVALSSSENTVPEKKNKSTLGSMEEFLT